MIGVSGVLMRCRVCRYIYGINEMQAVKAYWGTFTVGVGVAGEEYLLIYPGDIV